MTKTRPPDCQMCFPQGWARAGKNERATAGKNGKHAGERATGAESTASGHGDGLGPGWTTQSASHTPARPSRPHARKEPQSGITASGQDGGSIYQLDGRGERIKLSAKDTASAMKQKLDEIKFHECQEHVTAFTGEALDEFKKQLKAKSIVAAEVKGTVKTMLARLEKSVSADAGVFNDAIAELNEIPRTTSVVMEFLQFMKGGGGLDLTESIGTIKEMQDMYELGNTYILRVFEVKVQMAMTYQDAMNACGLMTSNSEEAKSLTQTSSPDQIAAFVQSATDDIVIGLFGRRQSAEEWCEHRLPFLVVNYSISFSNQ